MSVGCFVLLQAEPERCSAQSERPDFVTAMIEGQRILKEEVPEGGEKSGGNSEQSAMSHSLSQSQSERRSRE